MLGLVGQSYAMAMQGDLLGARTTADEALDYSSEDLQYFDVHCSGVVAVACLAAGDAAAAWEASEAARQLDSAHENRGSPGLGGPSRLEVW